MTAVPLLQTQVKSRHVQLVKQPIVVVVSGGLWWCDLGGEDWVNGCVIWEVNGVVGVVVGGERSVG